MPPSSPAPTVAATRFKQPLVKLTTLGRPPPSLRRPRNLQDDPYLFCARLPPLHLCTPPGREHVLPPQLPGEKLPTLARSPHPTARHSGTLAPCTSLPPPNPSAPSRLPGPGPRSQVLDLDETMVHSSLEVDGHPPDFTFPVVFEARAQPAACPSAGPGAEQPPASRVAALPAPLFPCRRRG